VTKLKETDTREEWMNLASVSRKVKRREVEHKRGFHIEKLGHKEYNQGRIMHKVTRNWNPSLKVTWVEEKQRPFGRKKRRRCSKWRFERVNALGISLVVGAMPREHRLKTRRERKSLEVRDFWGLRRKKATGPQKLSSGERMSPIKGAEP